MHHWIFVPIIFFIIFIIRLLSKIFFPKHKENLENKECPYKFKSYWSQCKKFPNKKCLQCRFTRPGLYYRRNDDFCCNVKCKNLEIQKVFGDKYGKNGELCPERVRQYKLKKKMKLKPYYCKEFYKCAKHYPNVFGEKWCGIRTLTNSSAKIYDSLQECERDSEPYIHLNRNQCLRTTGAGWCTDINGHGFCIEGSPLGPRNLYWYNKCFPNQTTGINSWIPGLNSPFITQNFGDNKI